MLLFLGIEGVLRFAFVDRDGPLGTLAEPWRYGRFSFDSAYWELKVLEGPPQARQDATTFDPRYGWRCWLTESESLEHRDEARLRGRRPLLLFGDSYAGGVDPDTWRDFPEFVEQSDLAQEFALLNYGVGGYGLDQIWLQMRDVLARHADARPVVIVSLLVDDDIDRCVLSFRTWPKPRLRVRDGRIVDEARPVPRMQEYFESHASIEPFLAVPFLAQHLDRLSGARTRRLEAEKQELGRALLRAIVEDLRARDLPFLFVLFHHSWSIQHPEELAWRARLVQDTLDGLDAAWVTVRPALIAHARRTGRDVLDYFLSPEHPSSGHYNALGDAVAFAVVREGLKLHLGLGQGGDLVLAQDVRAPEVPARVEWREADVELSALGLEPPFLWTDLDAQGRGRLRWTPGGAARALRGRAQSLRGELLLECHRDGRSERLGDVFEIDLTGVETLELVAQGRPGARWVLSELHLESARRIPPPLGPDPR